MALVVENLTVKQGERSVVKALSMSIEAGQVSAVLGANGAGKSELVLAIAGMLPVAAGRISVDGVDITGLAPDRIRQAGVAAVPEGHRILGKLNVHDNLRAAAALLGKADEAVMLESVYQLFPELAQRKQQIAGTMSGGQQQMLAIGHAIMAKPKYLLIDEMSLGLAPLIVKRLVSAVSQLVEQGVGLLLVEQFTEVALGMANEALLMRTGEVRFYGPVAEVKANPSILDQAYF